MTLCVHANAKQTIIHRVVISLSPFVILERLRRVLSVGCTNTGGLIFVPVTPYLELSTRKPALMTA